MRFAFHRGVNFFNVCLRVNLVKDEHESSRLCECCPDFMESLLLVTSNSPPHAPMELANAKLLTKSAYFLEFFSPKYLEFFLNLATFFSSF